MIINNTPTDAAVMSGVSAVGEFRIRNSAKAFGILSSGLYANKIRAIVRELSCNAVDSHVAAGVADRPFDLHLPTQLAPWFAIRDYGVGLDHEQIMDIYTTYFASTKTDSNDFIGALGLGSKSPFSYTDNFTITAVKAGVKRVYSAFINENGVPSVAAMGETETDDPNGVEIRFAVNDRDFYKFADEAQHVFRYFTVMPIVSGAEVDLKPVTYSKPDVMPGVHVANHETTNIAIMGNIAYPIVVPNASAVLGDLVGIDKSGLEIEFANGDLEFQASREGLSYTKKTIDAIRDRYQQISDNMLTLLTDKLNAITNHWDRAEALSQHRGKIYTAANIAYNNNNPNPVIAHMNNGYVYARDIKIDVLAAECNIDVRQFVSKRSYDGNYTCTIRPVYAMEPTISYAERLRIIVNIDNKKIMERAKYHFRNQSKEHEVYMLYAKDPARPVDLDRFMSEIYNPPARFVMKVDDLTAAPVRVRKTAEELKNLPIMKLNTQDHTWRSSKEIDLTGTAGTTFYYVPLKGRTAINSDGKPVSMKDIICCYREVFIGQHDVYGVRSSLIDAVKTLQNWIPWLDNVKQQIVSMTKADFYPMAMAKQGCSGGRLLLSSELGALLDDSSPYKVITGKKSYVKIYPDKLNALIELIDPSLKAHVTQASKQADEDVEKVLARYPMLCYITTNTYSNNKKQLEHAAEYIKLVDSK